MFSINTSYNEGELNQSLGLSNEIIYLESLLFLGKSRVASIYSIMVITLIGLIGNGLILLVFAQKKYRNNSNNVYLFCLALNDSLYLLVHVSEDTLKVFKETYSEDGESAALLKLVNFLSIVDNYEITCLSLNYLRNVLRSISSYIIALFTIQRLLVVYKPLSTILQSKKSAWKTIGLITLASFVFNVWVLFLFELQKSDEKNITYCDIKRKYTKEYFVLSIIYTILIAILPMILILICNILIIFKTIKDQTLRKELQNLKKVSKLAEKKSLPEPKPSPTSFLQAIDIGTDENENTIFPVNSRSNTIKVKPFYMTEKQLIQSRTKFSKNSSLKLTITLLLISFLFVVFNLPYLITWSICFYKTAFSVMELSRRNYLFAVLHITEIFFFMNYVSLI